MSRPVCLIHWKSHNTLNMPHFSGLKRFISTPGHTRVSIFVLFVFNPEDLAWLVRVFDLS